MLAASVRDMETRWNICRGPSNRVHYDERLDQRMLAITTPDPSFWNHWDFDMPGPYLNPDQNKGSSTLNPP